MARMFRKSSRSTATSQSTFLDTASDKTDWIGGLILAAKFLVAGGDLLPLPYLKGVAGMAVVLLEFFETLQKNDEELKILAKDVFDLLTLLNDLSSCHGKECSSLVGTICQDFSRYLENVLTDLKTINARKPGLRNWMKGKANFGVIRDRIYGYRNKITEMRLNYLLTSLMEKNTATMNLQTTTSRIDLNLLSLRADLKTVLRSANAEPSAEQDYTALKPGDIHVVGNLVSEVDMSRQSSVVKAHVKSGSRVQTVRKYSSKKHWSNDLSLQSAIPIRHPNVCQLFSFTESALREDYMLIYHDDLIDFDHYLKCLPTSDRREAMEAHIRKQELSVKNALRNIKRGHDLGFIDSSGNLRIMIQQACNDRCFECNRNPMFLSTDYLPWWTKLLTLTPPNKSFMQMYMTFV